MPETPKNRRRAAKQRWECGCCDPPILLAMYEPGGQVEIKIRDRFYMTSGCVHATCPRCGTNHILDLRPPSQSGDSPATPATDPGNGWW